MLMLLVPGSCLEKQGSKEHICKKKKNYVHLGNFKFALLVDKMPKN